MPAATRTGRGLDHLVLATPDVDATATWLAEATGVSPSPGGSHVGFGTRNVLFGLGAGVYLEIVGPDKKQGKVDRDRPFRIDGLTEPGIVTWCAKGSRLQDLQQTAASAGLVYRDPLPMQRQASNVLLSWELLLPSFENQGGVLPFFIDWGETAHPSGSLPEGLRLTELSVTHPDPTSIGGFFAALGVSLEVSEGTAGLAVRVQGPKAEVTLRVAEFDPTAAKI